MSRWRFCLGGGVAVAALAVVATQLALAAPPHRRANNAGSGASALPAKPAESATRPDAAQPTAGKPDAQAVAIKQGMALVDRREFAQAVEVFQKAYAAGAADAGFYLGRMAELGLGTTPNPAAAAVLYRAAADKGSAKAMNRVGLMQFKGEAGVLQDFVAARATLCKAAEMGDHDAEFNCAEMWFEGKAGPKDAAQALPLYLKAADGGHIGALNLLGLIYRDGIGVAKDAERSQNYFARAAAKGNPVGLYETGRAAEAAYAADKAAGAADKAAEQATAAAELIKAHMFYNLAGARNHPGAAAALQRLTGLMSENDLAQAQAAAKAWKATP